MKNNFLIAIIFAIIVVAWLQINLGIDITIWIIGALVLIAVFAGGALFAHATQRLTLDAIAKYAKDDAMVDKFRMQSYRDMTQAESKIMVLEQKEKIKEDSAKRLADSKKELATQIEEEEAEWYNTENKEVVFKEWQ